MLIPNEENSKYSKYLIILPQLVHLSFFLMDQNHKHLSSDSHYSNHTIIQMIHSKMEFFPYS